MKAIVLLKDYRNIDFGCNVEVLHIVDADIKYDMVFLDIHHVVMEEALKLQRKVHTIDISENSINNFILPKLDKGLIYEQRTY